MGLRILMTNIEMNSRSGTTIYVRDLALELRRQGHSPVVYTLRKGSVADELQAAQIPVTRDLGRINFQPEVIHGHHFTTTLRAAHRFPGIPAIFVCHDHTFWDDKTPFHKSIRRYFGVSRICVERLIKAGVPEDEAQVLLNFVDTNRFLPRPPLPDRPRRALVFSNSAHAGTHLPAVAEACRMAGLALDVVGTGVGRSIARPEEILGRYDIVFAKAKAAMEAMAVGTAVVLCDFSGVGPMVTAAEFEGLRSRNFGFEALHASLKARNVLCQILRYDAREAARVRDLLRGSAGLDQASKRIVGLYDDIIREQKGEKVLSDPLEREAGRLFLRELFLRLAWTWGALPLSQRQWIKKIPGIAALLFQLKETARKRFEKH